MGCKQTKIISREQCDSLPAKTIEGNQSHTQNVIEPAHPLTARQIFKLKKNWKGIKRNMEEAGVEMFIRLFRQKAGLQDMFKAFQEVPLDDTVRENTALENHGILVMSAIDEAISNVDDLDYVKAVMLKIGQSHNRFNGFTEDLFWQLETPFLDAVKVTLGDRYSDQMDEIYRIIIKYLVTLVSEAYRKGHTQPEISAKDNGLTASV